MNPLAALRGRRYLESRTLNQWLWTSVVVLAFVLVITLIVMSATLAGWMIDFDQRLDNFATYDYWRR